MYPKLNVVFFFFHTGTVMQVSGSPREECTFSSGNPLVETLSGEIIVDQVGKVAQRSNVSLAPKIYW